MPDLRITTSQSSLVPRCACAVATLLFVAGVASAQDAPPADETTSQSEETPVQQRIREMEAELEAARKNAIIEASKPEQRATEAPGQLQSQRLHTPLLREGSYLTEAPGRLINDEQQGLWFFEVDSKHVPTTTAHNVPFRFIVMPSTTLEQMQRTLDAIELDTVFQMTGRIFVYGDNNYLLPLDAPVLRQADPALSHDDDRTSTDTPADDANVDSEAPSQSLNDIDADALKERLRREVPIARALAPAGTADISEKVLATLKPEGELLVLRRGRIVRNTHGGFDFVFTADATGQADPPMTLLPCLLLEKLTTNLESRHERDAILVTGQVFTYRGRNFLLPTMYRVERFNDNLQR